MMISSGRLAGFATMVALLDLTGCASRPPMEAGCDFAEPSREGWVTYDEGDFSIQLPPDYKVVPVQGIDSQVGRWEAPGRQLHYDLGYYGAPLEPTAGDDLQEVVICQESDGDGSPQIARYQAPDGDHIVRAHFPDVRLGDGGMATSLTLEGAVERPEDQGELLAIVRSAEITTPERRATAGAPSSNGGGSGRDSAGTDVPGYPGYRAGGNEPFWDVRFEEATIEFYVLGGDSIRAPRPSPERQPEGWRYTASSDGRPYIVRIENRICSDSMSGRPFPHTVEVTIGDETYTGCGGDTASLITGGEWVVDLLEGVATTGSRRPTLLFSSSGELTGTGGCNQFRATYEITGEGLRIGPPAATRMACVDARANEQELEFFRLLEQVDRFSISSDGSLVLHSLDQPIVVASR